MNKLLIIISAVAFVLAGCSGDAKVDEQNIVKEAQIGPKMQPRTISYIDSYRRNPFTPKAREWSFMRN
ncbi:MAG: hypothetical protein ACQEXQ_29550, partial [Bacillota bacterium]